MAWLWSDDVARMLIDEGLVEASRVSEWIASPVAFAVAEDADPRAVGSGLLGLDQPEASVA